MTTNNHPAHGPVSLDRLSLNDAIAHADERAEALFGPCAAQHAQLATWLRELQERRKADSADPVSFDELNAAVAEVTGGNQHAWNANIYKGHQEVPFMNYNSLARIVDKYRVPQPAPVVVPDGLRLALSNAGIAAPESDEMLSAKSEKLIQALVTWVKERKPFQSAPAVPEEVSWEDVPEEITEDNMEVALAWAHGFNQCRAAMLQGKTGGNSPVIPDGWVACSERVPNDEEDVLCFGQYGDNDIDEERYQFMGWLSSKGIKRIWRVSDGDSQNRRARVTHWMPLPAAPQQEAKNV